MKEEFELQRESWRDLKKIVREGDLESKSERERIM